MTRLRIAYLVPGLGPCGGLRVIVEHVNRLALRGHEVFLVAPDQWVSRDIRWIKVNVPVVPANILDQAKDLDVIVATGFPTVQNALLASAKRKFYFVQMMEHLFFSKGSQPYQRAVESYALAKDAGIEVITIAKWLKSTMLDTWSLESTIVPNGVNKDHFHRTRRTGNAIVVEGDYRNAAKDTDHLTWEVAFRLREKYAVEIIGYSAFPHQYTSQYDRYIPSPSTGQMSKLYSRGKFLLKASHYEGRSCSPVEAMCCGTPSVRAIEKGDDDLIDGVNCLRVGYDAEALYDAACRMMEDDVLRQKLTQGARQYAGERLNWSDKIDRLEELYGGEI